MGHNGRFRAREYVKAMSINEKEIIEIGQGLIFDVTQELTTILEKRLTPEDGKDWFKATLEFDRSKKGKERDNAKRNLRKLARVDIVTIYNQVLTVKNQAWRSALVMEFNSPNDGEYIFKLIKTVYDSRHIWFHKDKVITEDDLLRLADAIYKLFGNSNHPLGDKCESLLGQLRNNRKIDLAEFSRAFGEKYQALKRQYGFFRTEYTRLAMAQRPSPMISDFIDDDLKLMSREHLMSYLQKTKKQADENLLNGTFFMHVLEREKISNGVNNWLEDITKFFINTLNEYYLRNEKLEIAFQGERIKPTEALQPSEFRDCCNSFMFELSNLVQQAKDFAKEAGSDKCRCALCQIYGPVSEKWFITSFDPLHNWAQEGFNPFVSVEVQFWSTGVERIVTEYLRSFKEMKEFYEISQADIALVCSSIIELFDNLARVLDKLGSGLSFEA